MLLSLLPSLQEGPSQEVKAALAHLEQVKNGDNLLPMENSQLKSIAVGNYVCQPSGQLVQE